MSVCGPSNAIPSCAATPSVGFGSRRCGLGGIYGLGSSGYGVGSGESVPAACLGVLQGVHPSCINQLPPQEVTIQPPPATVVCPGPILVAGPDPVRVGGHSPCSSDGISGICGYGGVSCIGSGLGYRQGLLGSVTRGVTCSPCVL